MVLLVNSGGEAAAAGWRDLLAPMLPGVDVRWMHDPAVAPDSVRYAFCWMPRPGFLATLPGLELIVSSGAGVDHITSDPDWPRHVPIVRMGGDETAQKMAEYVTMAALCLLRDMPRMVAGQRERRWDHFERPLSAREVRAGVMGLGNLGATAARMLAAVGFQVAGWSRTPKAVPGVECFAGEAGRDAFLARTDVLVCLLPDTAETRGTIGAELIGKLPDGASVINAGRGGHVVMDDLLAALDGGALSGAVLDVFEQEPLPAEHPAWAHPRVMVTPHIASMSSRPARARYIADVIGAFERGDALPNLFDPVRGY